ncbi:MAG: hypothetical protein P4N59_28595 [Negativicutes bacterium]|nr:hypothetical protein [Negativicutes bacterium]
MITLALAFPAAAAAESSQPMIDVTIQIIRPETTWSTWFAPGTNGPSKEITATVRKLAQLDVRVVAGAKTIGWHAFVKNGPADYRFNIPKPENGEIKIQVLAGFAGLSEPVVWGTSYFHPGQVVTIDLDAAFPVKVFQFATE